MGYGNCFRDGGGLWVDQNAVKFGTVAGYPGCVGGVGVSPLFHWQANVERVVEPDSVCCVDKYGHCVYCS